MRKQSKAVWFTLVKLSYRKWVQLAFLIITLYIGVCFYGFAAQLETGLNLSVARPPGVEAFLPISALLSLKYLIVTGIFSRVHPSALVLFLIICATALILKRSFCSWVCPIGFLSDLLSNFHFFLFKKRYYLPKWADIGLRVLKYTLAGFFIWTITRMPVAAVAEFIQSPSNRFADIKMLELFTRSPTALFVILLLAILSTAIPHFWCRYLCPYGAFLGFLSVFSLGKVRRNNQNCTHCKKCETLCPGRIQITKKAVINSPECSACLRCIDACPQKEAIGFSISKTFPMPSGGFALALIALFIAGIITAKHTGYWRSQVSPEAYRRYVIHRQKPRPLPPRMAPGKMDPEKIKKMIARMKEMQTAS